MQEKRLFDDRSKYCTWCNRPIPIESEHNLCSACQENEKFREIRDYVREHDVNEFELADIFEIPLRQVKKWIREGRLEYKEDQHKMENLHCDRCGKPIKFGTLCPECSRLLYGVNGGYETKKESNADEKIRFYNKNNL